MILFRIMQKQNLYTRAIKSRKKEEEKKKIRLTIETVILFRIMQKQNL